MNEELDKRHEIFEYLLDEFINEGKYYSGSLAYANNKVIFSQKKDQYIDLRRIAKIGLEFFAKICEGVQDRPLELLISGELRKIYLRKFWIEPNTLDYLLVVVLPSDTLYFRRTTNKFVKKLCNFLP